MPSKIFCFEIGIKWTTRCILHTCPSPEGGLFAFRFPARSEGPVGFCQGFRTTFHGACSCSLPFRPVAQEVLLSVAGGGHSCQQRMALRVNTTGNVLVRNVGRDGAEAVDTTASVAVKRKFGETTYSLRATESTIKNIRALNGALVQMSKPLGENSLDVTLAIYIAIIQPTVPESCVIRRGYTE